MSKYDFPIKYALQPLHGYVYETEHYKALSYIVTKCYVIENSIRYFEDGSRKEVYKVVFPFSNFPYSKDRVYPVYSMENGNYNVREVDEIFDNYEDADLKKCEKNLSSYTEILTLVNSSNGRNFADIIEARFNLLDDEERNLIEQTKDMQLDNNIKKNVLK